VYEVAPSQYEVAPTVHEIAPRQYETAPRKVETFQMADEAILHYHGRSGKCFQNVTDLDEVDYVEM
jgi:hypothetical protein